MELGERSVLFKHGILLLKNPLLDYRDWVKGVSLALWELYKGWQSLVGHHTKILISSPSTQFFSLTKETKVLVFYSLTGPKIAKSQVKVHLDKVWNRSENNDYQRQTRIVHIQLLSLFSGLAFFFCWLKFFFTIQTNQWIMKDLIWATLS